MGEDKQEKRSKGLLPPRGGSKDLEDASWQDASPQLLQELVVWITTRGGAARFGLTRDGGTYSVGLYLGEERVTYYFRRDQDIDAGIRDLLSELEDIPINQIPTDRKARKK